MITFYIINTKSFKKEIVKARIFLQMLEPVIMSDNNITESASFFFL